MTEDKQHFATERGSEQTLVTPVFDEHAAETARPVVPLPENRLAGSSFVARTAQRIPGANAVGRPSWMLGLILVSVLVGSVLGGLGLRFYQKRQYQKRQQSAAATTTTAPVAVAEQPAANESNPALIEANETAAAQTTAQVTEADDAPANILISDTKEIPTTPATAKSTARDERASDDAPKPDKESRNASASERKRADADNDGERKKSARDDNERAETRPRRTEAEKPRQQRQAEADYDAGRPRARIVDSITIEAERIRRERRRAERQERRQQRVVDRVRGIFEGQP
ncbi:MAG TPA: hypothetical protein VF666_21545 [Pyrinomonadaceae bacterium]|jgi:hypothetical protein